MPNANRGSVGFRSDEFDQEYDRPSKSELKRQSNELQKLGEQLIEAPGAMRVDRLPLLAQRVPLAAHLAVRRTGGGDQGRGGAVEQVAAGGDPVIRAAMFSAKSTARASVGPRMP